MLLRHYFLVLVIIFGSWSLPPLSAQTEGTGTATQGSGMTEMEEVKDIKEKKKKRKKDEEAKNNEILINMEFFTGLGINIIAVLIIIGFIYINSYHKSEIIFTYFSFNLVIFFLTLVMNNIKFSTGAAFGLFAVFSMLRYRTEGISTKDMTYLFIVIAIGLICALKIGTLPMIVICGILILATFLLDGNVLIKRQFSKQVLYANTDLIKPEHHQALLDDLRVRTGLDIYRVSVGKIDFVKGVVNLEIFYYNSATTQNH